MVRTRQQSSQAGGSSSPGQSGEIPISSSSSHSSKGLDPQLEQELENVILGVDPLAFRLPTPSFEEEEEDRTPTASPPSVTKAQKRRPAEVPLGLPGEGSRDFQMRGPGTRRGD